MSPLQHYATLYETFDLMTTSAPAVEALVSGETQYVSTRWDYDPTSFTNPTRDASVEVEHLFAFPDGTFKSVAFKAWFSKETHSGLREDGTDYAFYRICYNQFIIAHSSDGLTVESSFQRFVPNLPPTRTHVFREAFRLLSETTPEKAAQVFEPGQARGALTLWT